MTIAEAIEAAQAAYHDAEINPVMKPCSRCEGRGYHHGFGEHGHDPDWCEICGGDAVEPADPHQSLRAAIARFLEVVEPTPGMRHAAFGTADDANNWRLEAASRKLAEEVRGW